MIVKDTPKFPLGYHAVTLGRTRGGMGPSAEQRRELDRLSLSFSLAQVVVHEGPNRSPVQHVMANHVGGDER
ncbi:hypothetical protein [Bradyrhizobium elkanii]|uniref:hypothetical protein n=1 Tax=Bradyrhizobium elkanii TaxID=29448 RepID=UPI00351221F5